MSVTLHAAANSCIWYADDDSIRQVQTSTNQVSRVIALRDPHRLVMNAADCGVWTLDKRDRRLLRYNGEGVLEREIRVRSLDPRLDEVERLHIDPYDDRLWITDERRIYHLNSSGQLTGAFSAPGDIRRMRVALDRTLWVLGKHDLWHFDATGKLLASHRLGRHLAGDARYFAVDSLGGVIWLADDNELAQLKQSNPADPPLRIRLRHDITGFTLDPLTGKVWVAQKEALLAYTRDGAPAGAVDLRVHNVRNPEKLAFDPVSRSLWVGAVRSITRFTDDGEFVVQFRARDGDEALGVPAFKVEPTLVLERPPQNALTNSPQPQFILNYGAACNSLVCALPNDYLAGYQLTATLNSLAIGSQFTYDSATGQASFTPATRLPEGANTFTAQVKDRFGLLSNQITNAFTVDTIAPRFLTVTPADGAVFSTAQAILQGSIDDPQASVVLDSTGLNQTGANFSFPVILLPGANTYTLSAIDRAGNRSIISRTLIRSSLSLTINSPAAEATLSANTVLVSGTVTGDPRAGVTVNGVVASFIGGQFYATVPLQPGMNEITVIARSLDGSGTQQTINVTSTSTSPAAVEVIADTSSGVAPFKVTFTVNTALAVQSIEADFDGNGTTDFATTNRAAPIAFTYNKPGVYMARFVVSALTNGFREDFTQIVPVIVIDPVALDVQLKALWQEFAGALAARDKAKAMQYMTSSAQERYGRVFDALLDSLPGFVASMSPLRTGMLSVTVAEYAVTRPALEGPLQIFFLYFMRDSDGVWRLESM